MDSLPYIEALKRALPAQYLSDIQALPSPILHLFDTVVKFTSGGECPENAESQTKENWRAGQAEVRNAFDALRQSPVANGSFKRSRDEDNEAEGHTSKKTKTSVTDESSPASPSSEEDDLPLFTLHSLSLQSPLRKKLDIVVHKHTLRLVNPSSHAVESSISLKSLKRAFLLNTRGKTKAHWTVVIIASDVVAPKLTGKAAQAAAANGERKAEERQIVFGVDATSAGYSTTDHTTSEVSRTSHPKGSFTLPQLRIFLEYLPISYHEPNTSVFCSAASCDSGGEPIAGVATHRAAKEGTLWFFDDGILWDGRPCEYWSIADLVPGADDESGAADAVRFVSATGKTGSVFIRRRVSASEELKDDGEEEDSEDYIETVFNPVDAKEQDAIVRWAKKRRQLFGFKPSGTDAGGKVSKEKDVSGDAKVDVKGKGKAVALPQDDSDDSDDSDFVDDSESDGGSASSDVSDSGEGEYEGNASDVAEEFSEDEEEEAKGEEEEEELDPKHHPLLREGAVPRMSGAAMQMAIGLVTRDMLSGGSGSGSGSKAVKEESVESEDEDQEDQLDE